MMLDREYPSGRVSGLAIVLAVAVASTAGAQVESTGPLNPATVATADSQPEWTDPSLGAIDDDTFASILFDDEVLESALIASGFPFTIPFGSVITGVEVTVSRHNETGVSPTGISGGFLMLPDGTTTLEEDIETDIADWDVADVTATFGGEEELWGLAIEAEDVADSTFALLYRIATTYDSAEDNDTYSVDGITAEVFYLPPELLDPCDSFPSAYGDLSDLASIVAGGTSDMDGDGLSDEASLALLDEVACNDRSDPAMREATLNAYNKNLLALADEVDGELIGEYWDIIALLMAASASFQAPIIEGLAADDPAVILEGTYTAVTCDGSSCSPDENLRVTRSTDEPYSATGDLDADGVDNLTEYDSVMAQGGVLSDFVIAATTNTLDGTEPIRTPGGPSGGCFIATAAYGTPLAAEVQVLRVLRDRALLQSVIGVSLVDVYYRTSPAIAENVAGSRMLATAIRVALVPVLLLANLALHFPASLGALAAAAVLLTLRARRPRRGRVR